MVDVGYKFYSTYWPLKDGRLLAYIMYFVCAKLPIHILNFIVSVLSIAISCYCVILIYDMILNLKEQKNKLIKFVLLSLAYLAIFNFMYVETIYFIETLTISLSMLMYIFATRILINTNNLANYVKAGILVLIGIFSYQGTISYFIILSISLLIIKNNKINREVIKKIIIIGLITFLCVLTNIIFVKYICNYLNISQNRFSINNILDNIIYIICNLKYVFINSCGLVYNYLHMFFIAILFIIAIIYNWKNKNELANITFNLLLIILITIFASFIVFLTSVSSIDCARMYIGIGALFSIMCIYLYTNTKILDKTKNGFSIFLIMLIFLFLLINIISYIVNIENVQKKNALEKKYCNLIKDELINELTYTDNLKGCIIRIEGHEDDIYFKEIKAKNKMTINEIIGDESAISSFNVNTGLNIKEISPTKDIINQYKSRLNSGDKRYM